jgi:hypothetical protein
MEIVMLGVDLEPVACPGEDQNTASAMKSSSYQHARERCQISCRMIEQLLLKHSAIIEHSA